MFMYIRTRERENERKETPFEIVRKNMLTYGKSFAFFHPQNKREGELHTETS